MKILFICKHNRFRSKVAEYLARKRRIDARSAGVRLDFLRPYVCESVKKALVKKGIKSIDETSREVNEQDLKWADKIIIAADNVSSSIFDGKTKAKIEIWKIEDADESEEEKIKMIIDDIEERVNEIKV